MQLETLIVASLPFAPFRGRDFPDVVCYYHLETRTLSLHRLRTTGEALKALLRLKEDYEESVRRTKPSGVMAVAVRTDGEQETVRQITGLPCVNATDETPLHSRFWDRYGLRVLSPLSDASCSGTSVQEKTVLEMAECIVKFNEEKGVRL